MNRSLTLALAPLWLAAAAHAQSPPGIVISQYYEGTSNNKYIELWNPTAADIPLAGIRLATWSNAARENWKTGGAPSASFDLGSISPGISLQPGGFLLLANPSVALPAYAASNADTKPSASGQQVINFNGDDSVVLYSSDSYLPENILDAVSFTGNNGTDKTFYRLNTNRGWASDIGSQITDFPSVWATDKVLADVATAQPSDPWYLSASTDQPVVSTPPAQSPNTAPTVVIKSATMRGATGLMDVVFRVNDPDDTTVKTRALAFIDGQRSFAKLIKPVTFAEGTGSKIGGAIATNTDHTLTWNLAADWNIDLGQIKFEILAMDNRGLLPLDWVTIPATNGQPELTISKNAPTEGEVLDALFWQYASGDPGLKIENGILRANATAGTFSGVTLVNGSSVDTYGPAWAIRAMNLTPADRSDVTRAATARSGITGGWHALRKPYEEIDVLVGINFGIRPGFTKVSAIAAGGADGVIVMSEDGTIEGRVPSILSGIRAIAAGAYGLGVALKNDGTVSAWADFNWGQTNVPDGLSDVIAISSKHLHSLALKSNGTVAAWGYDDSGATDVPSGLQGVVAIETSNGGSLAKRIDGTFVAWGNFPSPSSWEGIETVAAGVSHAAGLRTNGTVHAWGNGESGATEVPIGLTGVVAVDCGHATTYALKGDGTVVAWGKNQVGQTAINPDIRGVTAIAAGNEFAILLKKAP